MRRRILTAMLLVAALTIVLFGIPLALLVDRFVDQEATLRLEREAILASRDVPADFATSNDPVELPSPGASVTLALFDPAGRRVAGRGPSTADEVVRQALDNHIRDTEQSGVRVVAVPVTANEEVIGAIRAAQPTAASDARIRDYVVGLAGLALLVFGIGAVSASVLARRLARPVRALSKATVDLGAGDFAPQIPPTGINEIDEAARALRQTAARLEELLGRERAFSADASHQLRTPLAGMRAAIETELAFPRGDRDLLLGELLDDVERLEQTVAALLHAARDGDVASATADPNQVLDLVVGAWRGRLALLGRPLRLLTPPQLPPVRGAPTLLVTALDVLLDNALTHGAGEVGIEAAVSAHTVTISVVDEGPGIPTDLPPAEGLHGHGLSLASRLVESTGGRLVLVRRDRPPRVDLLLVRADLTDTRPRR